MKQKIYMYKEMKAHQILELQMREQSIVAASRRGRIRGKKSHRVSVENHFPEMPQAV